MRLACALGWLAGHTSRSLHRIHLVSRNAVYDSVWMCVDAINAQYHIAFDPNDRPRLKELREGFAKASDLECFKGTVAAVDGLIVRIKEPGNLRDVRRYYVERKKCFGLNLQAACDAECRFVCAHVNYPGSTSDWLAWQGTPVGHALGEDGLPKKFFFVGDAAYALSNSLLTPIKGAQGEIDDYEDSYNFHLSQVGLPSS